MRTAGTGARAATKVVRTMDRAECIYTDRCPLRVDFEHDRPAAAVLPAELSADQSGSVSRARGPESVGDGSSREEDAGPRRVCLLISTGGAGTAQWTHTSTSNTTLNGSSEGAWSRPPVASSPCQTRDAITEIRAGAGRTMRPVRGTADLLPQSRLDLGLLVAALPLHVLAFLLRQPVPQRHPVWPGVTGGASAPTLARNLCRSKDP